MSVYTFNITKDRYQLSFTTTNRDFIEDQFSKWVYSVSDYVQKHKVQQCKEMVNSQINAEKEITQQKIDEQLKKHNSEEKTQEKVSDRTQKNLDIFYAPPKSESKVEDTPKEDTTVQADDSKEENSQIDTSSETVNNFDNILEKSIEAPQAELSFKPNPSIKKDNAFINFISTKPTDKKIDYLLMTAYYFTQYEQKPRFTLKQLNAKLMQNIAIIIDHSILQEAINRDYIECLPDLTGLVGATEYRLTAYGEKVLLDD